MDKSVNDISGNSRLFLLLKDRDGRPLDALVLASHTDKDRKGLVVSQLQDDKGNPVGRQWLSSWGDYEKSLQAQLNATYGRGVYFKAYANALKKDAVMDNTIARLLARDGNGSPFIGSVDLSDGESNILNINTSEQLSRRSFGEEFRKEELEQKEYRIHDRNIKNQPRLSPSELESLSMNVKEKGKVMMTAIVGGKTINHEMSQEDVKKMSSADPQRKIGMFTQTFKEIDMKDITKEMSNKLTTVITEAIRRPGDAVSMPRPEVYESRMSEETHDIAASLQAMAASAFADTQEQSIGRGISMGR